MITIPTVLITPSGAADAYNRVAGKGSTNTASASSFGDTISQAVTQAISTGKNADTQAMSAISGSGNLTEVVTALSHAEMTLQTATTIRDRVIQAYQDIIKMPI